MTEEIGTLTILDETGDRKMTWKRVKDYITRHKEKHDEIKTLVQEPEDMKQVRLAFEAKQKQGYDAYELDQPGDVTSGRKITKFNPEAKFIVQVPHIVPGRSD
jgi:hypothetical protein